MAGLDERLHDLVAAAGREVPVPPPEGLRRRGNRRRAIRSGAGGLAVLLLAVGCLLGVRAAQDGPDRAVLQPSTSELPSRVQIEIVPSVEKDLDLKLVEAEGRLSVGDFEDEGLNDLWSFPQPDPTRNLYQIEMVSPGAMTGCLSSGTDDHGLPLLLLCDAADATQLWSIESDRDTVTIRGLGPLLAEDEADVLALLVDPAGGPRETPTP